MPRYKNTKPSILGLRFGAGAGLRTVLPGEVFEADAAQIPQVYLVQRWIVPTTDPVTPTPASAPGVTDQQAALSGAYGEEARNAAVAAAALPDPTTPTEPAPSTPTTPPTTPTTPTTPAEPPPSEPPPTEPSEENP